MKNRVSTLLTLLLLVASVSTGCGKASEDEDNPYIDRYRQSNMITVGFSQLGAESDWRVANTDSIKNSLTRENGIELMFDDAQQKQDKQIIAIRNFTQQEVDCIVLAPVMETGWDTVLEEAQNAGIPVVIVDRMVDVEDKSLVTAWDLISRRKLTWLASGLTVLRKLKVYHPKIFI